MRDMHEPGHVGLATLIGWLREGRFAVPDFQREFEWDPQDIRELMRSIFQDYYIGSLLLWKGTHENFSALSCESIHGFDGKKEWNYIVLDGQQRLTAMYYAFFAPNIPAPRRHNRYLYFLRVDYFMREEYDDAFQYEWTRRGENILNNRERQYEEHTLPLSIVGSSGWELSNWAQGYASYWNDRADDESNNGDESAARAARSHADSAAKFGEYLKGILQDYQIAYIMLDSDIAIDKVCDIFTKINSRGLRLDAFDLINALVKPKGVQLKQLGRDAAPRLGFVRSDRMDVYVLQVMSILCQEYCSPKYLYNLIPGRQRRVRKNDGSLDTEVLIRDATEFIDRWERAVEALEETIGLLSHPGEYGVIFPQLPPIHINSPRVCCSAS